MSLRSTVAEKMNEVHESTIHTHYDYIFSWMFVNAQVSSLHSSAMEALTSVKKNDVLEVMSYREPPASAIPVFNSLCMLFDRPQTSVNKMTHFQCPSVHVFVIRWEECKLLLLSPNFFESLKFFDKDHIPRQKLRQLKVMLKSPLWRDETLQHSSK